MKESPCVSNDEGKLVDEEAAAQEVAEDADEQAVTQRDLDQAIEANVGDNGADETDDLCSRTRTRKQGLTDLQKRRCKIHSLHYTLKLLVHELNFRRWCVITFLPRSLNESMGAAMRMFRSPAETAQCMMELIGGSLLQTCHRLFLDWCSADMAERLEFKCLRGATVSERDQAEDKKVAEHCQKYLLALVSELVQTHYLFAAPPLNFLRLLTDNADERTSALTNLEQEWRHLEKVETAAQKQPEAKEWLTRCIYPQLTLVREFYIRLEEVAFKHVPDDMVQDLRQLQSSHHSTLLIENTFNKLRQVEKTLPNGRMSNAQIYYTCANAPQQQQFQRPGPSMATLERVTPAPIREHLFTGTNLETSVSKEALDRILSPEKGEWRSTNAHGFKAAAQLWHGMQAQKGEWSSIQKSVYDDLVEPGTLIVENGTSSSYLVLCCTGCGVCVWRSPIDKRTRTFQLAAPGPGKVRYIHISDPTAWKSYSVEAQPPPFELSEADKLAGLQRGLRLALGQETRSLYHFAAQRGFNTLNLSKLRLLVKMRGSILPRTASAKACLEVLLQDAFGEKYKPSMLDEISARRDKAATTHTTDNTGILEINVDDHFGDNDDLEDDAIMEAYSQLREENKMRQQQETQRKRDLEDKTRHDSTKRARTTTTNPAAGHDATGSASSSRPAGSGRTFNPLPSEGYTVAQAQALAPPGCKIEKDTKRENRWTATSKMLPGSGVVSRSYGRGSKRTQNEALKLVLSIAWRHEFQVNGQSCPHDLDVLLGEPSA
ncbi:Uncharacterized protein SCF082_LOCUS22618 [Durusdinium trenchii]|uniref:Uncharacterized protein n=1 Tax=Durusdinium trenchii TaxID=1381693 RepID=A0ABP0LK45_9DINO